MSKEYPPEDIKFPKNSTNGGKMVRGFKKISLIYLKGYFVIDFLATVPMLIIRFLGIVDENLAINIWGYNFKIIFFFYYLKMLRLFYIPRMV